MIKYDGLVGVGAASEEKGEQLMGRASLTFLSACTLSIFVKKINFVSAIVIFFNPREYL